MSAHDTIIKFEKVDKSYAALGETERTDVLHDINFEINSGDFAIIYGPSGSGKSTVLHHMIGLELPDKGKIVIRDTDITKLDSEERAVFRSHKFGMVYQFWYWAKALTVLENVAMPLYVSGFDDNKARKKAWTALEEIGMTKYAQKSPIQLSGGEQQRVAIARALVNDPWIIVADEPTGNLDTHNSDLIMQTFQELNVHKKRTIILVTHNLGYFPLANKTIALKDGRVVSSSTEELKQQIRSELKGIL